MVETNVDSAVQELFIWNIRTSRATSGLGHQVESLGDSLYG